MIQKLPKALLNLVDHLNEEQLHALNHLVVERMKLMHTAHALYAMKDFHILDRVFFDNNGQKIEGVITRFNQKTITVTLNDGSHWNVSPGFITKIDPDQSYQLVSKK